MAEENNLNIESSTPPRRKCGTMAVYYRQLEDHPEFRRNLIELESRVMSRMSSAHPMTAKEVAIPVVVHVLYNKESDNISDAQVQSQIRVLNEDYTARNSDKEKTPSVWKKLVSSANIHFELATTDASGKKSNRIVRVKTDKISFGDDDTMKSTATGGSDSWPTDKYLNIWVCNLGNGLLGYAQFPGGPAATDGVVILNTAFGTEGIASAPFDKGRTTTHEVGHWLNLRHIWGDTQQCEGTDYVGDTPNQQSPNFGKPVFPHLSCSNAPNGDMFMNYMDYVDDDTMVMFTAGQVARMQTTLEASRKSIGS